MSAAAPVYLPTDLQAALQHARYLAECGVPLFVAEPALDAQRRWDPSGGSGKTGYRLPSKWQHSTADPSVVDSWQVGKALCAVMGHLLDAVDLDPRNGGTMPVPMPRSYAQQRTPSGGSHDLIASLGVRSRDGLAPGVDLKAGIVDKGGHGFIFLAPTVKLSKSTGERGVYTWVKPPRLDELVLIGGDTTGATLKELLAGKRSAADYVGPSYDGADYAHLSSAERAWADRDLEERLTAWQQQLDEAANWPEGARDDQGRGWEALSRDLAWALAVWAHTPWMPLNRAAARQNFHEMLPSQMAATEACADKWTPALLAKAAKVPVDPPPWQGMTAREAPAIDVANAAHAAEWLRQEMGQVGTPLAGLFRRGEEVVHTPHISEDGYICLTDGAHDSDGPAQVRRADAAQVQARVQFGYQVTKWVATKGASVPWLFPTAAVNVVLGDLRLAPQLRVLRGVTHTPMLRRDGTVLDTEGYDSLSQRLFLPEPGLSVKPVPERPADLEIEQARDLLLSMLVDFPFNTDHDQANFLALLLTPLLREIIPPPYKMGILRAHERGSGKSLLAWILRTVHGGVLRGDVPKDGEEFRKQITSILASTTAPVVQFDNVKHMEASQLDALLTTDTWSDRRLGASVDMTMRNDRLWVATGNNASVGGDLSRRVLWVSIDPQQPHPEERTDFTIPELKVWVTQRRGELLHALLVLTRHWLLAGSPLGEAAGADDYARWLASCRGLLALCGFTGVVGHSDTVPLDESGGDSKEAFLALLWEHFKEEDFTTSQALTLISLEQTPADMKAGSAISLGRWLSRHEGQWAGGLSVRQIRLSSGVLQWQLRRAP